MNPVVRVVRIMQFAFIFSVLLFLFVLHTVHPAAQHLSASFQWGIVLCAIASAGMGFIGQRAFLRPSAPSLPTNQNPTPLARWFSGHLLRFATAESVALFAFALRMMGSTSILVYLLFGGSLLLLLTWRPGTVPPSTGQ